MSNALNRVAKYAARPLLMHPEAARSLAARVLATDPRAFERSAGPFAAIRALASRARRAIAPGDARVGAFDDDGDYVEPTRPDAYAPLWLGAPDDEGEWGWTLKDGVALLQIDTALGSRGEHFCGTWWHGYDTLAAAFDEMDADERVRGIFVRHDSPGGVVTAGLPELTAMLLDRRQLAGGRKPIWNYCDMAASADYWIACSGDKVIAPRVGLVGSIGAVMVHYDYTQALAKDGIVVTPIEFPMGKTDGAWFKSLSPEALADLQAEVTECANLFIGGVVEARPQLSADEIVALRAGCFMGDHSDAARSGLSLKLVDDVMNEKQAFAALRDLVAQPAGAPTTSTTSSSTAAIAASPATPAPAEAAPAAAKEKDMKRSTLTAILGHATLTADAKLAQIAAAVEADGEAEGGAEDDAEGDDEAATPPADDAAPTAEGGEEMDDVDPKTAAAILDLPEAKGREALARKLAFRGGMTVDGARDLLAAAPKGSTLASRMAGREPNLTAGGGGAGDMGAALVAGAKALKAARTGRAAG